MWKRDPSAPEIYDSWTSSDGGGGAGRGDDVMADRAGRVAFKPATAYQPGDVVAGVGEDGDVYMCNRTYRRRPSLREFFAAMFAGRVRLRLQFRRKESERDTDQD